jgi:phenylacetic acid degradation protein
MPCYSIDGLVPVVDPSAHVHPAAVLIGDVWVGPGVYVGPCASLRGDFGRLVLEAGSNVQDNCTLHGFGAVLHGCIVRRGALIGMNAVVMDEAEVGEQAIVAASAFIRAGMKIPPRTLVAGVPGKVIRELSEQEIAWKHDGTLTYQALVQRCHDSLREVAPLAADDRGRRRLMEADFAVGVKPLLAIKR